MGSPATSLFSAVASSAGLIFVLWHIWHYDRFRCLRLPRSDRFRGVMVVILILSMMLFMICTTLEVHVLYGEFYINVGSEVVPAPWQVWTEEHRTTARASVFILAFAWTLLQAVHLEEFLYWGYLVVSLRSAQGSKITWTRSPWFRVWLAGSVSGLALLIGAACIETTNVSIMKTYVVLCGSAMSILLAVMSVVLGLTLPAFIDNSRKQGAAPEVLDRLHLFAEMNHLRTVLRITYTLCFFILSVDALTVERRVTRIDFWQDTLYTLGLTAMFTATCIAIMVLLPRNMTSESLPLTYNVNFHPLVRYKRPSLVGTTSHYLELGLRLNVDRDALAAFADGPGAEGHEMGAASPPLPSEPGLAGPNPTTRITDGSTPSDEDVKGDSYSSSGGSGSEHGAQQQQQQQQRATVPHSTHLFANAADSRHGAVRRSQLNRLPQVLQRFAGPFDAASSHAVRGPTQVFVTTQREVHRDDE